MHDSDSVNPGSGEAAIDPSPDPSVERTDDELPDNFIESTLEELFESDVPPEIRQILLRILSQKAAWTAPLPPPVLIDEYERIHTGAADKIFADFERRSQSEADLTQARIRALDQDSVLQLREQELRERESASDIRSRDMVIPWSLGIIFFCLIVAVAIVFLWPADQWARVAAALVFMVPVAAVMIVVSMRGRVSDNERDVMTKTLPQVVEAVVKAMRPGQASPETTTPEIEETRSKGTGQS